MNVRKIVAILALSSLFSTATGGYLYYRSAREAAVRDAEEDLVSRSQFLKDRVVRLISANKGGARALARFEELQEALVNTNPGTVSQADRILDHFVEGLRDDVCYLVDRAGNTIASSNRDKPDSFVGQNYSFRPYFREALEGKPSTYLALGVTSGIRGVYFSHPVYLAGSDSPLGVVITKASIEDIEREISGTNSGIALLVHSSGIIFASSQPDWVLRFLWQATPEELSRIAETKQFGEGPWNWTGLEKKGDDQVVDKSGETYSIQERDIENCPGWRLVYLYSIKSLSRKLVDPLVGITGYAALILCVFVCVAVIVLYRMAQDDIRSRKLAEQGLTRSEKKYRELHENLRDGLAAVSPEGMITEFNRAFKEMLGYEIEEIHKLTYEDVTPPQWHSKEAEIIGTQVMKRGYSDIYEKEYVRKDGTVFPVELRTYLILDDRGGYAGMWAFVRDISERKRVEEALCQSEEKFRLIFEFSPLGVFHFDQTGTITACNGNFVAIIGSSREKLIGLNTIRDLGDMKMIASISEALSGRMGHYEGSYTSVTAQKTTPVKCEFAPILTQHGTVLGGIGIIEDITEREQAEEALRRSERLYRSVIENIGDVFYRSEAEGRLLMGSPSGAKLFGYDSVEEMIGLPLESFWVNPKERQRLIDIVKEQGKVTDFEGVLRRKDGSTFVASLSTHFYRDQDGAVLGTEGIIRDISERKRIEAQLLQAQKMEAIGTLAGGIAHDVNNLLQIVLGHADMLLLREGMDEKSGKSAESIRRAARNGADLVRRILTFSRKSEPEMRPINLSEEVRRVVELLRRTIPRMISLEMSLEDNLRMINADPSQIEQILLNLAANARDAMPEGGRLVFETGNDTIREEYCRTHPEVKPGKYVLLAVSDTGQGIARGILDRIFEPFFTTKQPGEGTGLGLSMVFGVVKNHGGHITCYSEAGVGSTFRIYFPALAEDFQPDLATTIEMPAGGTEKLLLVDDEGAVRTLEAEMLELAGYTVLTAASGREALEVYRHDGDSIDLVILDLVMPAMSGRKCLEELLKMNPNAKVLIASGYAANGPVKEACESGAAGFVSKPFDLKQILLAIRKILDRVGNEH